MSDYSRNNLPEESIEETRRKKMEEFRRSADRSAIRGEYDYSGDTPSADYTSYEKTRTAIPKSGLSAIPKKRSNSKKKKKSRSKKAKRSATAASSRWYGCR